MSQRTIRRGSTSCQGVCATPGGRTPLSSTGRPSIASSKSMWAWLVVSSPRRGARSAWSGVVGDGVVSSQLLEPLLAVDVGPRVADMDDEDVDPEAVGDGQGRPHPPQAAVGLGLADQGVVDLAEVVAHPADELAALFLVDLG